MIPPGEEEEEDVLQIRTLVIKLGFGFLLLVADLPPPPAVISAKIT